MLVPFGGTGMNMPPAQSISCSSCRRNSPHPWSRVDCSWMDLFLDGLVKDGLVKPGFLFHVLTGVL
jgi:hypothetical protein